MRWHEFLEKVKIHPELEQAVLTDIECPNCGRRIYREDNVTLTIHMSRSRYFCIGCDWEMYR